MLLTRTPAAAIEQQFLEGFTKALRAEQRPGAPPHNLHIEYLDMAVAPTPEYLDGMATWLRRKYAGGTFDAVVVHGAGALQFALTDRAMLGTATLVVAGVEADVLTSTSLPRGSVGATVQWDVRGTLDLAWQLLPDTERVIIVAGATRLGRSLADEGIAHIRRTQPATLITDLTGASWEDALVQVSTALPRTVVLVVGFSVDGRGRTLNQLHAFEMALRAATAPMFTINSVTVGIGSVGGHMLDFSQVGANAARQLIGVLNTPGAAMGPARLESLDATRRVVDEAAARRWGVHLERIPTDVDIVNRQPSLWRDYRQQVVAASAGLLLLAAGVVGLLFERTLRRRAEAESKARLSQLLRMDRASALGQMSAALAHQLNQPLGTLRNYAEGAERLMNTSPLAVERLRGAMSSIRTESQRASDVVERVRSMFEAGDRPYADVDLNAAVADIIDLTRHEAQARGIELASQLPERAVLVRGDEVQLEQAVLNLLMNALDACAGRPDARIEVILQDRTHAAELLVIDNGSGISAELLPKIFDPFFTTKHQGVGMGLALVRSITEAHGGQAHAQRRGAGGMVMRIHLPRQAAAE